MPRITLRIARPTKKIPLPLISANPDIEYGIAKIPRITSLPATKKNESPKINTHRTKIPAHKTKDNKTTRAEKTSGAPIGAAKIAIEQAGEKAKGSVLASDAFFPMPDTVQEAIKAGVTAIIQPGGSIKDQLSIDECNEHGIAMVFTGVRHFKH